MTARNDKPDFERMQNDLARARSAWRSGRYDQARAILKMVASIAFADSVERKDTDPVAERLGMLSIFNWDDTR